MRIQILLLGFKGLVSNAEELKSDLPRTNLVSG